MAGLKSGIYFKPVLSHNEEGLTGDGDFSDINSSGLNGYIPVVLNPLLVVLLAQIIVVLDISLKSLVVS